MHPDDLKPGQVVLPQTLEEIRGNAQIDADAEGQEMVIFTERGRHWYADQRAFTTGGSGWPRKEVERVYPTPAAPQGAEGAEP